MAASIDSLVGCLLIATWLNSILFGIQIIQGNTYFKTYADPWYIRLMVIVIYCVDFAGLAGQYATVYLDSITHYGNAAYLSSAEPAPRGMYLVAIQLTAAIVQIFLITRLWRLSGNIWICIPLWLGSLLSLAGGFGLTIINLTFRTLADRPRQAVPTRIWLVVAAVVDVLIAVGLVVYLWRAKQKSHFAHTHNILKRLMTSSLETGSLTAVLAIIVEVLFSTLTQTNLQVAFVFLLGRAYGLTLMTNLNAREELRKASTSQSDSGAISLPNRTAHVRNPNQSAFVTTQSGYPIEIQVAQTAMTHMDDTHKVGTPYSGHSDKAGYV